MGTAERSGLRGYFSRRVREVTPAQARHAARVFHMPFADDAEATDRCTGVLSRNELERARRFAKPRERAGFIQRRAFQRFCAAVALDSPRPLGAIQFEHTAKGRPFLCETPDTWFGFSSCSTGFLGAWSSTHAIGVDLETGRQTLEAPDLARQYFSAAEARAVGCRRTFLKLWCLKEAALKSIGEGLPFGLEAFEFEPDFPFRLLRAPAGYGGPERFCAYAVPDVAECAMLLTRELMQSRKFRNGRCKSPSRDVY